MLDSSALLACGSQGETQRKEGKVGSYSVFERRPLFQAVASQNWEFRIIFLKGIGSAEPASLSNRDSPLLPRVELFGPHCYVSLCHSGLELKGRDPLLCCQVGSSWRPGSTSRKEGRNGKGRVTAW